MTARHRCGWLLVAIAIFVVLGHVCASPLHAHAGAVTTHSEDHPEHSSDEAAHGGSCEALRGVPGFDVATPVPVHVGVPLPDVRPVARFLATPVPAPTSSPPLFLLHASFLI